VHFFEYLFPFSFFHPSRKNQASILCFYHPNIKQTKQAKLFMGNVLQTKLRTNVELKNLEGNRCKTGWEEKANYRLFSQLEAYLQIESLMMKGLHIKKSIFFLRK